MIEAQQAHMLEHLHHQLGVRVDVDSPLVSTGLVDSLALVDVVLKLEAITGLALPMGQVQPKDLETVRTMFVMATRLGRPGGSPP